MKHRGVGGLISMIGLVIVFGIASAAFLQINATQQSFVASSINVNKVILDKNNQRLNFTITDSGSSYTVGVNNTSSQTIFFDAYLLINSTDIRQAKYLDGKNVTAGRSFQFDINLVPNGADKHVIFVTDLGKKCLVPIGVDFRIC
ncbi:hypothetical protein QVH35_00050 [Candidatus Nitrosotenuis chungbukensis]|uniref:hypothetical protein n=1 Tax=Candidatus Nitrosotenuis chungbukensis TaxID=1353246 RepID=UPI0012FEBD81|nr:hypothetical protein [Candidatus Nitrosotenuis chungbukensis]WKT57985.1 hypothetical protein QVH35_00050 [Candidatus Nitrosotenuis chungbukensis]